VLSKEETGVPGYVRQQYVFNCFGEVSVVDHYGAPIDPNDENILQVEKQMCAKRIYDDTEED
jgi:hypothetical protein